MSDQTQATVNDDPIQETPRWECVLDAKAGAGEVPVWSERDQRLYWVDVPNGRLNRTDLGTRETTTWQFDMPIGCYGLDEDGSGAICAVDTGVLHLDFDSDRRDLLFEVPFDTADYCFNDGRVDAEGRFWPGSKRLPTSDHADGGANFWRVDAAGMNVGIDGVTIANGIAWNRESDTMYVSDRVNWQILAFDFDRISGTVSNRRSFTKIPEGQLPDGAAVDVDGGYWCALFKAGRIVRFNPDGSLDRDLKAPTTHPTMVCFGGADHRTMFVTTARDFLDEDGLRREPQAGGIFACDVGAQGFAEPYFRF